MKTPPLSQEFADLLELFCLGELSPLQASRLEELVTDNPTNRDHYLRFVMMHAAALRFEAVRPPLANIESRLTTLVKPAQHPGVGNTPRLLNRPIIWSVTAASVLFAAYIVTISWNMLGKKSLSETDGKVVAVAEIIDSEDAQWSVSKPIENSKSEISSGEPLSIESGLVELQLKQGTTLLIEGPAEWKIDGENSATLTHGKLVARVPRQAVGFTLETPSAKIVDLGTEFGVEVAPSQANVTVFVGSIDLHTQIAADRGQPPVVLQAGESARVQAAIDGSQVISKTAHPAEFKRQMPEKATPQQQLTARQRLLADPELLVHYKFDGPGKDPGKLLNLAQANRGRFDGEIQGGKWVEGMKPGTSALAFQSVNDSVHLDVPGKFSALSMATSVYLESTGNAGHWHGLVMSDRWNRPGQFHWEVARGKIPQIAIHGAKDVFCPTALVTQDFGRWLILAVVCDTREQSVAFYRDGALMDRCPVNIKGELVLGPTQIGNWVREPSFHKNDVREFRGKFAELFIFSRALTTGELSKLF